MPFQNKTHDIMNEDLLVCGDVAGAESINSDAKRSPLNSELLDNAGSGCLGAVVEDLVDALFDPHGQ
jgi:hypothetical protein